MSEINLETTGAAAYHTGAAPPKESVGSIVAKTHVVYGTQLLAFFTVAALWILPGAALFALFPLVPFSAWIVLCVAQFILVYPWSQGATYMIALAACRGTPIGPLVAYREIWGKPLLRMIAASAIVLIGTVLGLLLFIVPGIIFVLRCGLIYPAVVLNEGVGGFRAVWRCREITRKRTWRLFVLLAAFTAIEVVVSYLLGDNVELKNLVQIGLGPLAAIWGTLFYMSATGGKLELRQIHFMPTAETVIGAAFFLVAASLFTHPRIFVQAYTTPSASMAPTIVVGDHIIANNFAYGLRWPGSKDYLVRWREPRRGDLVIFPLPEDRSKDFIKRVVAVGGETVEIREKKLYVNGHAIDDPHAYFEVEDVIDRVAGRDNFGPKRVPENHIFVLGDNRNKSYDSRFWGFVTVGDVTGRAHVIYWSWDQQNRTVRWNRIGSILD